MAAVAMATGNAARGLVLIKELITCCEIFFTFRLARSSSGGVGGAGLGETTK